MGEVGVPAAQQPSWMTLLPGWVTLLRAPNPGPMTLDGTNTWVLRAAAGEPAVVVDPGPDDAGHLAAIAAQAPVAAILVTHGHPDHVEGAAAASRLLADVPVLAVDPRHGVGAPPLAGAGPVELPTGPIERVTGLAIEALPSPGHTADSVCFVARLGAEADPGGEPGDRVGSGSGSRPGGGQVVLTGDTILGRGTAVVAWPDGDLAAYLTSLATLTAYPSVALPGHGPALADCAAVARAYLDHRRDRLDQVRAALAAGARSPADVVAAVYPDVDPALRFAAEWTVRAQLAYLNRESSDPGHGLDPL